MGVHWKHLRLECLPFDPVHMFLNVGITHLVLSKDPYKQGRGHKTMLALEALNKCFGELKFYEFKQL